MILGLESILIIILMVSLVALLIYYRHKQQNPVHTETFSSTKTQSKTKHNNSEEIDDNDNDVDNLIFMNKIRKHKKKYQNNKSDHKHKNIPINTEFTEMQYHKDYNDTITGINNLTPQKELFNLGFLPVIESKPAEQNVKSLIKLFLKKLNFEVDRNVQEYLHTNSGWNDMGKRRRKKSGFEEQMEELGLPGTLYTESASKAKVNLVNIDRAIQYTTDDQIRFTIYIIVQKENVKDQMVLQVQFFMEKEDLNGNRDDRADFFEKGIIESLTDANIESGKSDQSVIIEQVFTLGYLTNSTVKRTKMDKFHDYENIARADGTIDQEKVLTTMLKKHKERANELNSFIGTLGDEAEYYEGIDGHDSYSQYKDTRTIMDDLNQFPHKSFGDIPI